MQEDREVWWWDGVNRLQGPADGSGFWGSLHVRNSPAGWLESPVRFMRVPGFYHIMEVLESGVSHSMAGHSLLGPLRFIFTGLL